MRLLYICLDPGVALWGRAGSSVHVREVIGAFSAEGHRISFVGTATGPRPIPGDRPPVACQDWTDCAGLEGTRLARELDGVAAAVRPDLVYERYALGRTEGQALAARLGVPHVLEVNAPLVWEAARYRGVVAGPDSARLERQTWRGASLVVVPSTAMAGRVRQTGQAAVCVVPNAAPTRPVADRAAARARLGLDGRFAVGCVGSMKPWHDIPTVVRGVAALPSPTQALLMLVGEGPDLDEARRSAAALGVDLLAPGFVPPGDLGPYLSAMDVGVCSLARDADLDYFSPLKVMDYLTAGRPVVAAAVGDLMNLGRDGVALVYQPGDPSTWPRSSAGSPRTRGAVPL